MNKEFVQNICFIQIDTPRIAIKFQVKENHWFAVKSNDLGKIIGFSDKNFCIYKIHLLLKIAIRIYLMAKKRVPKNFLLAWWPMCDKHPQSLEPVTVFTCSSLLWIFRSGMNVDCNKNTTFCRFIILKESNDGSMFHDFMIAYNLAPKFGST